MAVALGIPETCNLEEMTNERCQEEIVARGYDLNPMKGIIGAFYRDNRKEDLRLVCLEALNEMEK